MTDRYSGITRVLKILRNFSGNNQDLKDGSEYNFFERRILRKARKEKGPRRARDLRAQPKSSMKPKKEWGGDLVSPTKEIFLNIEF